MNEPQRPSDETPAGPAGPAGPARHAMPGGKEFPQKLIWVFLACAFGAIALYAWATDYVTLAGERTVYTAACEKGTWVANRCTGMLVPAQRYRFRALKARGEVLFWTIGVPEPSSKYTGCTITSGRDWSCPANADAARTITLTMKAGDPVADPQGRTRAYHSVPKVKWLMLRAGISLGATANE